MAPAESGALLEVGSVRESPSKAALALTLLSVVVLFDLITKAWIVRSFSLYESVQVLGDWVRITYTHNRGAAFGIHVGEHSRIFFLGLSAVALVVLGLIYRSTSPADRIRIGALALVAGGALGNIVDRLRYDRGVVDFLDVGVGVHRWPVFNVADMAVSTGAILLLLSFYFEGRREAAGADSTGETE
ncbi:MAG: signal peptidase II [Gemmatimonadota bacterium]